GHVYVGFRDDIDPAVVRQWVDAQDTAALLGALNKIPVGPGDTCLVPAGVPHAVGTGITVVEVQEPTDFSILLEWKGFAVDGPQAGHLGLGYAVALEALDYGGWDRDRLAGLLGGGAGPAGRSGTGPAAAAGSRRVLPGRADPAGCAAAEPGPAGGGADRAGGPRSAGERGGPDPVGPRHHVVRAPRRRDGPARGRPAPAALHAPGPLSRARAPGQAEPVSGPPSGVPPGRSFPGGRGC